MIIEEVKGINFRNYEQFQIQIHPKLNIFVGENAQGKTNILEAIYLCAIGKSFRTNKEQEMINIIKDQSYVKVKVNKKDNMNTDIEIMLDIEKKKKIKVNKIPLIKVGELLGNLNVVLFSPEDLKIIKEGPKERRKYLDNEISQIMPKYYYTLNQYNKILQQRNQLLRDNKVKNTEMEIWNDQLVNNGSWLMVYRRNFIKKIGILSKLMHRKITEGSENLEIKYKSDVEISEKDDVRDIKEKFMIKLKRLSDLEEERNITLTGPHRDDLIFKINGMDVKNFGSQGQQRTSVLSLKLAELELIKGEVGEYPVLLLDDVMSELDVKRQKYLINSLKNVQTFITTTSMEYIATKNHENMKSFIVSKGEIYNELK